MHYQIHFQTEFGKPTTRELDDVDTALKLFKTMTQKEDCIWFSIDEIEEWEDDPKMILYYYKEENDNKNLLVSDKKYADFADFIFSEGGLRLS